MPEYDEDRGGISVAAAITDLTHAVGTADGTVADVTAAFDQTVLNNNFKELSTKVNAILAVLRSANLIALD